MYYKYIVGFYVDQAGNMPVSDYLMDGKNLKDLHVIINVIQSLALIGQEMVNDVRAKEIKHPIYELRKDRHRIFYAQDGKRFVLLSAFLKTSQKTPTKEIERAKAYYQDYLNNHTFFQMKLPPPALERY